MSLVFALFDMSFNIVLYETFIFKVGQGEEYDFGSYVTSSGSIEIKGPVWYNNLYG